jgi:hypothetical protein
VPVRDAVTLDDLGICHAPPPIEEGGPIAFEHGLPLTSVLWVPPGSSVVPVLARRSELDALTHLAATGNLPARG